MKTVTWVIIAALALMLNSGLTTAGISTGHQDWDPYEIDGRAESILGVVVDESGFEFQVVSYLCTEKSDFVMQRLSPASDMRTQLLLIRVVPDFCDGYVPYGVKIFYSYKELGLEEDDRFTILNPLSSYRVEYIPTIRNQRGNGRVDLERTGEGEGPDPVGIEDHGRGGPIDLDLNGVVEGGDPVGSIKAKGKNP